MTTMRIIFAIAVSLWAFSFLACAPLPKGPEVSPNTDASAPLSHDDCGLSCFQLRRIGCREGLSPSCEETCAELEGDGFPLPIVCIAAATTADAVRRCGSIRCLP